MKKLFVCLIFLLLLSACSAEQSLNTPTNLRVEDRTLYWDEVENATGYYVLINEKIFTSSTNSYYFLEDGTYKVKICAKAEGYKNSLYSELFTFTLEYQSPTNIVITNNLISWDELSDIKYYVISIDNITYQTVDNSYPLLFLEEDRIFCIKVKAVYLNNQESKYSNIINHSTYYDVIASEKFFFNKNTNDLVEVDFSEHSFEIDNIKDANNKIVDEIVLTDNKILFSNSYLKSLDYGLNVFSVITTEGKGVLEIVIYDDRRPLMISSNSLVFDGNDVMLEFEVYDGSIVSIFGNDISEDDYVVDGNLLIISSAFIQGKFEENFDRKNLILGYHLSANTNEVIGYIFISRPES